MRITQLSLLLVLTLTFGACSHDSPQDICDCLDKSATDYMAKHPDLTKGDLEENGRDVFKELRKPCEEAGKVMETRLKSASATEQAEAQQLIQNCLNAIGNKMKAAAKDGPATEEEKAEKAQDDVDAAADETQEDADAKADAAFDDEADEATSDEASTSDATDVDALLDDYEEATEAYARYAKKSAAGDASATDDFSEAYQKAEEVGRELTPVQKQMTPKQIARFARLQAQMMQSSTKLMQAMK